MIRLRYMGAIYVRRQTAWVKYLTKDLEILGQNGNSYLVLKSRAKFILEFKTDANRNFLKVDIYPFIKEKTNRRLTKNLREKIGKAVSENQDKLYIENGSSGYYNIVMDYDVHNIKNLDTVITGCLN